MKRTIAFLFVATLFTMIAALPAAAAGYNSFEGTSTSGSNVDGYVRTADTAIFTTNPHGGYTSTSNKCKTCHAVHGAGGTYKLLASGTDANTACDYCHVGAGAHSNQLVYGRAGGGTTPTTINNGHTIGHVYSPASPIPDSTGTASQASGTLWCNKCHSVHGARAISFGDGKRNILRWDPLEDSNTPAVADTTTAYAGASATKVAFCQRCHNSNQGTASHPQTSADGSSSWTSAHICADCHNATGQPHSAVQNGYKMLTGRDNGDTVTASTLDDVCRRCHINGDGSQGIGVTF